MNITLEIVKDESKPCSGGWPMLRYKKWAIKELPRASVHLSYYAGNDVAPYPSLWIESPDGKGTKDLMLGTDREEIPSDFAVQELVEKWAEKQ